MSRSMRTSWKPKRNENDRSVFKPTDCSVAWLPAARKPEKAGNVFVGVTCLACGSMHLVNPQMGKTPSESSE